MRILFACDNFDHGEGGAEKSTQGLAVLLAQAGHEVSVLQNGDSAPYHRAGALVHCRNLGRPPLLGGRESLLFWQNRRWEPALEKFLNEHPADLIITKHRLSPSTVAVARRRSIPVINFVHAYGMFCATQFETHEPLNNCDRQCFWCLPLRRKLKYPIVQTAIRRLQKALRLSNLVIANSHYVARVIERFCHVHAPVLYPVLDLDCVRAAREENADRILFVKPQRVKGLDIFARIARAMPERRFQVAGSVGWHARQALGSLPNVELLGWVHDMRKVYQRTRLVVGPSVWPEPFGRIFVEAAINGIPSVASWTGGIPEAVGPGGILVQDYLDPAAWVNAIRMLDDPHIYQDLSHKAAAYAEKFSPKRLYGEFQKIIKDTIGLSV